MGIIVVCDTNVFVRETHLLRKKGGPALVRLLRAINGRLLIPEILQTEYIEQTLEAAEEQRVKVVPALSVLETLIGFRSQPLPANDLIEQGAVDRLRTLGDITQISPLSPEILEAAGRRSVAKQRPTSKTDHGYKDCLIWESVLRLQAGSEVRFVSHDKAFFSGHQLAQDLVDEAQARGIQIVGYRGIENLVRDLQEANPILDLAALEAQDLTDTGTEAPEGIAAAFVAPVPQATEAGQIQAGLALAAADVQEVAKRLAEARKRFDELELKILAYVAYLANPSKEQLFLLLYQAQIPTDVAKNVVERLVLAGFVRDIGNHYLVVDRTIGEAVAPIVEAEIIALLEKGADVDGH
ncbi:MAG: hypothetical protein A3F74_17515 [Betaproteobacteria bacterium RIFCSPLOWO2_12_FULL_62_58]|nr:MAG: hypothetical protein A3F74_17515 [Betaproteobacteria bacterium RIFCSPLOWO2_12_FULL_62_58]